MEKYFPELNEKYRKKNYPDGVFARMHKNTAKVSWLSYIFFGVIGCGAVWAAMWIMNKNKAYLAEGDASFTGMANVMAGVCGVFALICALCIIISVKRHLDGPKKLKKICAKESGYKVEEVETFEHQALDLDSQAISLLGTVAKTMSGQADGILTRDYVMLTLGRNILIKYEDLKAAVMVAQTIKVGKGMKKAGVDYLIVGLLGKNGSSTVAECTKESGLALIRLLKEKNPDVYTADEEILDDNGYLDVWGKFNGKKPPKLEEE